MELPIKTPQPDARRFGQIIRGEVTPASPPLAEFLIDDEVVASIAHDLLGRPLVTTDKSMAGRKAYWDTVIEVYYRLGYDYIVLSDIISPARKRRYAPDTAPLSRGARSWVESSIGPIASWDDFERYPWATLDAASLWEWEYAAGRLPEGMGVFACPTDGFWDFPAKNLLGYENLCYLLADDPALVAAVFARSGELIYSWFERLLCLPNQLGFWQGDDMGFETSTVVSPHFLRQHVLPWHKKAATLAHQHGLLYLLHACGNVEGIMSDLIDDVGIDAKHSFEDAVTPVGEFKRKYGQRIAVLGGVDVDALCRLPEEELRRYVRGVIEACAPGGRFALGSGNSITNYVPLRSFLIMLEEGWHWGR